MSTSVCVTIVTHNSQPYIETCLRSVFRQNHPVEVLIVDNASTDGTREILARYEGRVRVITNTANIGFAAAQNQAIAHTQSDWVLVLNPDAVLRPGFVRLLVEASELDEKIGSVCGRLLACGPDLKPLREPLIDSAGIYFTPSMRHFDRGWHQPDDGRFRRMEYVFGASAAAALYRREMIVDVADGDDFFDPDFFIYREDADVAWRAQLLGWKCLYVPAAVGYHKRSVGPGRRSSVPSLLKMHSVKNRFLMRIKNATGGLYRRYWLPATARDLTVVSACLLWEVSSLSALWRLAGCFSRAVQRRRSIMSRRRVADEALLPWFRAQPVAQPVGFSAPRQAVEELPAADLVLRVNRY